MPRGRHRHSPPLHRLLPPSVGRRSVSTCAAGAWLVGDPVVLRALAAAAAAAAVTGAVLMRSWDRARRPPGRRARPRPRASDEWQTEERIAELETDVEESRELRTKLDAKLRAKRVELAGLRNEHAALLRRYATAETERASALEGRRQLALEAAARPRSCRRPVPRRRRPRTCARPRRWSDLPRIRRGPGGQTHRRGRQQARPRRAGRAEADEPRGEARGGPPGERAARPPVVRRPCRRRCRSPRRSSRTPRSVARPVPEGGFDFFGTQVAAKTAGSPGRAAGRSPSRL